MNKQGPKGIGWCDYTWNPIQGCSKASAGCENCYAEAIARRFEIPWGSVRFRPHKIAEPSKVRTPSRVFVASMSDLWHKTCEPQWREAIFNAMRAAPWHTYIMLTKRPENIEHPWVDKPDNWWVGVTAENQDMLDKRLPYLHCIPGIRFVSVEPMLGPVTLEWQHVQPEWIICGPETGKASRSCDPSWIEHLSSESLCFYDKRKTGWTRREWPRRTGI